MTPETITDTPGAPPVAPAAGPLPTYDWASNLTSDGAFKQGWTDTLPADLQPYKPTIGKYASLPDLLRGLGNANALLGRKAGGVTVPGPSSTPEEVTAYRKAVGVPDAPAEYFKKPDQLPAGVEWDDKAVTEYANVLHKHGVSAAAAEELLQTQMRIESERAGSAVAAHEAKQAAELEAAENQLRKDWGPLFDSRLSLAATAATFAGADPEAEAFQHPDVVRAFAALGKLIPESKGPSGDSHPGMQTPADKAKDIQTNAANPMHERYHKQDPEIVAYVRKLLGKAA